MIAEGSHLAADLSIVALGVVCLIGFDTIRESLKHRKD